MIVNSKIRDSDWLAFTLTIVNFNYVFIQPVPEFNTAKRNESQGLGIGLGLGLETGICIVL